LRDTSHEGLVTLDLKHPIWERVFTVAPLVLVGTKELDGSYDLAPKHLAIPLSWDQYFGFVCTPRHRTYHNARREGVFTVSFPRPTQLVLASLAASPRCEDDSKPAVRALPTLPATRVDGVLVKDSYLHLECELHDVWDNLGVNSVIAGRIVAAHVSEDAFRSSDLDDGDLVDACPLLVYVAPGRYARVQETFAFPFPEDFSR
jgi:flavin reductase (DIM6/NTAB) family NADH-FMN oxidoreductase RutF